MWSQSWKLSHSLQLCVCVIVRVCFVFFSVRRRRRRKQLERGASGSSSSLQWPRNPPAAGDRDSEKNLYGLFSVALLGMVVVKTITVTISYLTATMTGNCTGSGFMFLLTWSLTQRITHMGLKTPGPCPSRVSDIAVKWHWHVNP